MRFRFLCLIFLLSYSHNAISQCSGIATAATSGNWNAGAPASRATWTLSGGATSPENACLIIIPNGITVVINNNQTWQGNVEVYGTLDLSNQLNLGSTTGCGLSLRIFGSGLLAGDGASERLIICGQTVVTGQPVPPPGAINWPADGSFSASDLGGSGGGFGESGVLPVELLFFKASLSNEKVKLTWATASEINFDFFSVEKSGNGLDFYEVARVGGRGTTSERQDYSLIDEKPLIGNNYYRLKSVDYDGYSEYYNVVIIDFGGGRKSFIYPNPVHRGNTVNLELNFTPQYPVEVVLYDLTGRQVERMMLVSSSAEIPIHVHGGMYMVRFNSPEHKSMTKLLVHE